MQTQLLCTFCKRDELEDTCKNITDKYEIAFNKIFVLENVDDTNQFVLTYNVIDADLNDILESTISVHRKKQSNTIYTINALNKLIMELNNGILDKKFKINWDELQNIVLVTAYGKLKKISTQLDEIIHL
jgi:hypothetical protein|tara:strand:- start:2349 stop:2738 length:390 start_codon:yes stop_codon:yes gene_type:complete